MSMDQTLTIPDDPLPVPLHDHTKVDTTRPFRSVKEAIAIFGERLLVSEIYSPSSPTKPSFILPTQEAPIWKKSPQGDSSPVVMTTLKKLEIELNETKRELKLLKEREAETQVALASLNAELHKNMAKMAAAEAVAAGKEAAIRSSMTLRQVLSGVGERKYMKEKKVMRRKKKPVIPLVTDLFAWKNGKAVIHY